MSNILVTGAAGFLGFHLARLLAEQPGNTVFCVDNFQRGEQDRFYAALGQKKNVKQISMDLSVEDSVQQLPREIDYVYHLAALNGTQNFYERPLDVIRACTLPTLFLADHYGKIGRLTRFIYAGTSESYASTVTQFDWEVPTGEDVPLGVDDLFNPRCSYGGSKLHGEIVTAQAGRVFGMPFSIIRYHNAYGPRMGDKHVVPDFYQRARSGVFELYGFEDTRSFLYVSDSVRATRMVAESQGCANQIVNIGSEREISIRELGDLMMKAAGLSGDIKLFPSPAGSVRRRAPKIAKLRSLTGFHEQVSLEDGLRLTAEFYLA